MRSAARFVVAAAVIASALTGCSNDEPPPKAQIEAPELGYTPIAADPARTAEDTMVLVAETVFSVRPLSEEPGDAWRRADPVLSETGTFPHRGPMVDVPRGRGQWFDWQGRGIERVVAHVKVTDEEHPADTDTVAARVLAVDLEEIGQDGTHYAGDSMTYYAMVTRSDPDDPWRVDSLMQP